MWRQKKKFKGPRHPWLAERIEEEHSLAKQYGIRRMRELWKAKAILKNWQRQAKEIIGLPAEQKEAVQKILLNKLLKYGLIKEDSNVDDVLSLSIKDILDRRLSTVLVKKGLALTPKQARQFIIHGKVTVNGRKTNSPSYLVKVGDEVSFTPGFTPKLKPEEKVKPEAKVDTKESKESGEVAQAAQATEVANG